MGLTVNDLVTNSALQIKVISKNYNLEKPVHWAHVCELIDPTEWLGDGDLLMTTGIGIPYIKSNQVSEEESNALHPERATHKQIDNLAPTTWRNNSLHSPIAR